MEKSESKPRTFDTLKEDAPIFDKLSSGNYDWWSRVKKNTNLYIEIRKDNEVHVYYEGGRVIRIRYCSKHKKIQAYTHNKYLTGNENVTGYVECAGQLSTKLETIIKNIHLYSRKQGIDDKEKWSEKFIQGNIIKNNRLKYLDSEFAYNNGDIRIDMVECVYGELRFVELKRIDDPRMVSQDMNPEILTQIRSYREFIKENEEDIVEYYKRLYAIKKHLGLPVPPVKPFKLNLEPKLLIFDRWIKESDGRTIHREMMEEILERIAKPKIDYTIINTLVVPKRTFYKNEQKRQIDYYKRSLSSIAEVGGIYQGKTLDFILKEKDCHHNLFPVITGTSDNVIDYFSTYKIAWWQCENKPTIPTGHLVSSQIHCLNHLFALRKDNVAIKKIIESATGVKIYKVLPSPIDKEGFITFEFVYKNKSILDENYETRGTRCTSIDALVYVELINHKKLLVPIEWKYTETYDGKEARQESFGRYSRIKKGSNCQKWTSLYRADPFYELMRQTLFMERIIKTKGCGIDADDYQHIVVCPKGNVEMMADANAFKETLTQQGKERFHIIDPQDFLSPLKGEKNYADLFEYLEDRYWK